MREMLEYSSNFRGAHKKCLMLGCFTNSMSLDANNVGMQNYLNYKMIDIHLHRLAEGSHCSVVCAYTVLVLVSYIIIFM